MSREHLPLQPEPFTGKIGVTYQDSRAGVMSPPSAPAGAPNVVVIMLDDVGFGQPSVSGGPARTPRLEQLAAEGAFYNRFHTTALCSPTRAALLSGRNHHSVHSGNIMELATAFPGYDGQWGPESASVAEVLKLNGYSTAAFGKWHNTPDHETSAAGPFDRWPTGKGFEYYWGFLGGEADQWNTPLWENTSPVERPADAGENWHFTEAMADKAIEWMTNQKASAPDKPFFVFWTPGAAHAPHHVDKEWSDRYRGAFDHGWDRERQLTFERQKALGIIPDDTELTPRPDEIPAWDEQSDDAKRLYARMQEVFAGFLEHTDAQAGRLLDALDTLGVADNTLVVYIIGDNGPSAEGTLTGTLNNMKTQHGFSDDLETMLAHIDEIGGPNHENHYPVPWCWAGSSPFQWMKQVASHFGGTRNGLVMRYPGRIDDNDTVRSQFHHVIDIAPTILEAVGIPHPTHVNGAAQTPVEGTSMAYTWTDAVADDRHVTQYFEMFGNRAIYHEGWVAGCKHKTPWQMRGSADFAADAWELYNVDEDFSQAHDLAAEHPEKLRELQDLFMAEAAKYNVLPLDDRFSERADVSLRPSHIAGKKNFTYFPGTVRVPETSSPPIKNVDHVLSAEIEIVGSGTEGVLISCGGRTAGYTFFVQDGKLHWEHNWFGEHRYRVSSDAPLPVGRYVVSAQIECDEPGTLGTGGWVTLRAGAEVIGAGTFAQQVPMRYTVQESFDIGCDLITPVSKAYESPFRFTGKLHRAMVDIDSGQSFDEVATEEAKLAASELSSRIFMATQ